MIDLSVMYGFNCLNSKSFILSKQNIFDGDVSFIEVTKERALDIDDPFDLQIAEMVLTKKVNKNLGF